MKMRILLALAALALVLGDAHPAVAQRGPDLDAIVRDMLTKKIDVSTAARTLLTTHGQSPEAAVGLLVRNGYRATEVAQTTVAVMRMDALGASRALGGAGVLANDAGNGLERAGVAAPMVIEALGGARFPVRDVTAVAVRSLALTPVQAVVALKAGGYGPQDVKDALDQEGVLVDLGCIDPQGYPGPCGNPGGDAATAMGAVTLTPASQGWTDSILTIVSTNIPEVDILLAGQTLQTLEASPLRVRVRLPSSPVTGPVVMRRLSDGVEGTLAASFAVVAPPPEPAPGMSWTTVGTEAAQAAVADIQLWLLGAELVEEKCQVSGIEMIGTPGVLRSSTGLEGKVRARLLELGATSAVADAFDRTVREAWAAWALHAVIPGLPGFPAFLVWPAAEAPPTPGVPFPMAAIVSTESGALTAPTLAATVLARLGDAGDSPAAQEGVTAFANVVGAHFGAWLATAQLIGYTGWGTVPTYSVTVPGGPVDGRCGGKGVLAHTHF